MKDNYLLVELEDARRKLKFHANDPSKPYWLGMVDGLVLAMGYLGMSTTPQKKPVKLKKLK